MGFVTLNISCFQHSETWYRQGYFVTRLTGSVMQMISHGLISFGLFFCIGIIYARTKNKTIDDQSGIGQVMPLFSAMMMFSLIECRSSRNFWVCWRIYGNDCRTK